MFYLRGCLLWSVFQNMLNENFSDYTFFYDQELLGNVQVDLPSLASGGQFVPPLPLNPFQGTLVVYTGTAGAMSESSDERQTPSDTHAREASETALSVRAVSYTHLTLPTIYSV